jgi:hypothetical protein
MSNRALLLRIRESFESSHRTYGSPRVWRDLRDWRVPGGLNRIAKIMQQAGLVARPRLRRPDYSVGKRSIIAPNILDRQFTAPNQKWIADFTYVATGEGWLYLAVVLDLYSRMEHEPSRNVWDNSAMESDPKATFTDVRCRGAIAVLIPIVHPASPSLFSETPGTFAGSRAGLEPPLSCWPAHSDRAR